MGNTVLDSTRLDSTINEHGISVIPSSVQLGVLSNTVCPKVVHTVLDGLKLRP